MIDTGSISSEDLDEEEKEQACDDINDQASY
jgi:hypothetical protein